jgi:hypothetical protein
MERIWQEDVVDHFSEEEHENPQPGSLVSLHKFDSATAQKNTALNR